MSKTMVTPNGDGKQKGDKPSYSKKQGNTRNFRGQSTQGTGTGASYLGVYQHPVLKKELGIRSLSRSAIKRKVKKTTLQDMEENLNLTATSGPFHKGDPLDAIINTE